MDFHWHKPAPDEDEEVDMIPLIDVSMVLLVFFMLTASSAGAAAFIKTPLAENAPIANTSGLFVGINLEGEEGDRKLVYSLGENGKPSADPRDQDLRTIGDLVARLDALLGEKTGPVEVTINAHKDVEDGQVMDVTLELCKKPRRDRIKARFTGVTEKTTR